MVLGISSYFGFISKPDAEWQRIIEKLWNVYGIRSSGSKALDKQILHEHELKDAQKESSLSSKFLTITKGELEKILAKKKSKKADNEIVPIEELNGAELFGQQVFLAIQMKHESDNMENKKKRNNKYQT